MRVSYSRAIFALVFFFLNQAGYDTTNARPSLRSSLFAQSERGTLAGICWNRQFAEFDIFPQNAACGRDPVITTCRQLPQAATNL